MNEEKPTGLVRILKAARYSLAGIKAAWTHEAAFRQELAALVVLLPLGLFLGQNGTQRALLLASLMIVIITELLNSAIEAVVDRTGLEYHLMSKRAKDMGSAAVLVSLVSVVIIWALILI